MSEHTLGPWRVGRKGTVVADEQTGPKETGHCDGDYYGGNLICESIWKEADARLIAAAPELLLVVEEYRIEIEAIAREVRTTEEAYAWRSKGDAVDALLAKVKGTEQ